jgi:hypothetical protein
MLRIDAQGVVAAVSGDLIQASDRLRVDAQDEAGGGCLAPLEAGLTAPFLLWADGGVAGATGLSWVCGTWWCGMGVARWVKATVHLIINRSRFCGQKRLPSQTKIVIYLFW